MQTHAGSALDNPMTLNFDLLTLSSNHAQDLTCTVYLPSLVLIAQAVFLLEHGHTDTHTHKVTDATDDSEPGIGYRRRG